MLCSEQFLSGRFDGFLWLDAISWQHCYDLDNSFIHAAFIWYHRATLDLCLLTNSSSKEVQTNPSIAATERPPVVPIARIQTMAARL